jgi:hypothetical protein
MEAAFPLQWKKPSYLPVSTAGQEELKAFLSLSRVLMKLLFFSVTGSLWGLESEFARIVITKAQRQKFIVSSLRSLLSLRSECRQGCFFWGQFFLVSSHDYLSVLISSYEEPKLSGAGPTLMTSFTISYLFLGGTRSHYVVQVSLELTVFPPQPPNCWDYRHVPPNPKMPSPNSRG